MVYVALLTLDLRLRHFNMPASFFCNVIFGMDAFNFETKNTDLYCLTNKLPVFKNKARRLGETELALNERVRLHAFPIGPSDLPFFQSNSQSLRVVPVL